MWENSWDSLCDCGEVRTRVFVAEQIKGSWIRWLKAETVTLRNRKWQPHSNNLLPWSLTLNVLTLDVLRASLSGVRSRGQKSSQALEVTIWCLTIYQALLDSVQSSLPTFTVALDTSPQILSNNTKFHCYPHWPSYLSKSVLLEVVKKLLLPSYDLDLSTVTAVLCGTLVQKDW